MRRALLVTLCLWLVACGGSPEQVDDDQRPPGLNCTEKPEHCR